MSQITRLLLGLLAALVAVPALGQELPTSGRPETYAVKPGNSLYRIARKIYGRADVWPAIASENHIQGPDFVIHVGQILRMPKLVSIRPVPMHQTSSVSPVVATRPAFVPGVLPFGFLFSRPLPLLLSFPTVTRYKEMLGLNKTPFKRVQKVHAMLTGYDACSVCTEKYAGDPKYGVTAIGRNAFVADGVATDPQLISYGTKLDIPGVGRRIVDDTGRAMRERAKQGVVQIDVRFATHAEALKFGVRQTDIDVYLE